MLVASGMLGVGGTPAHPRDRGSEKKPGSRTLFAAWNFDSKAARAPRLRLTVINDLRSGISNTNMRDAGSDI